MTTSPDLLAVLREAREALAEAISERMRVPTPGGTFSYDETLSKWTRALHGLAAYVKAPREPTQGMREALTEFEAAVCQKCLVPGTTRDRINAAREGVFESALRAHEAQGWVTVPADPSDDWIEIGRKAVEDHLVDWRDSRLYVMGLGNGLVICEPDGTRSDIIRLSTPHAIRIALKAMFAQLPPLPEPTP